MHQPQKPVWDIFCNVIDNWGDIGVCWRLAQQLSRQNIHIRLWLDDPAALSWMRDAADEDIEIIHWHNHLSNINDSFAAPQAFIEAFGCHAPDAYLQAIATLSQEHAADIPSPVWINLEYLSAQPYAEQLHMLPSLQHFGPAKGLTRWFFYPGFTQQTGGLLREKNLAKQQLGFCPETWLEQLHIPSVPHTLRISLFNYTNKALPLLLEQWETSSTPIHLLVTAGQSCQQLNLIYPHTATTNQQSETTTHGQLTITRLPLLTQKDFDHLLWSCDFNMVRGEDSWIRAIWAKKPFVWQPYIQEDGEHINKLDAFVGLIENAPNAWLMFQKNWTQQTQVNWNDLLATMQETGDALGRLHNKLTQNQDLCTSLIEFVQHKLHP